MPKAFTRAAVAVLLVTAAAAVSAHPGHGASGGFAIGFAHPLSGADHVLAMVAVGLWAALLGPAAMRSLPLVFPTAMVAGALLGMAGLPLAGSEIGIAGSALVLGGLIAFATKARTAVAAALVTAFALFHGYAHGLEWSGAVSPWQYGAGFVAATLLLHAVGIGAGLFWRLPRGRLLLRAAGAAVAGAGAAMLLSLG